MDDVLGLGPAAAGRGVVDLVRRCRAAFPVDGAVLVLLAAGGQVVTRALDGRLAGPHTGAEELTGEGPGVEAAAHWHPVLVDDLAAEGRWPGYRAAAAESGLRSAYCVPVGMGGVHLAVLCLVDGRAGALDAAGRRRALDAGAELAAVLVATPPRVLAGALALEPSVVQRAAGMVAVQVGCTVDEALDRLRARALADGGPLEALAGEVVARRVRLGPGDP